MRPGWWTAGAIAYVAWVLVVTFVVFPSFLDDDDAHYAVIRALVSLGLAVLAVLFVLWRLHVRKTREARYE